MQIFRDYQLTVLGLTETWHDTDSTVFGRCRMAGFSVVDRPRVRVRDDLSVNHGGVAIVAAPGTSLSPLPTGSPSSTFEVVAAHVTTGRSRAAIAVVYRPGSQPVTAQFFDDLSALLERLVVLRLPLFVTGDFNVRLDRDTHHAKQLGSVFETFGLQICRSGSTHRDGGVLDLVATRDDVPLSVVDVERSDHSLLHWPVLSDQPKAPTTTVHVRSWRRLDMAVFRSRLTSSVLCQPSSWPADSTLLPHCTMTSSRASSTTSSRRASLCAGRVRLTHGLMPTAALPSVSLAVLSGATWQLLVVPLLHLAVPLLRQPLPPLMRLDNRGITSDVLIAIYVNRSALRSGPINLRHRPVHVTCGLLSIDCWVVGIVPATVFLPTTFAPSSQKRWNVSGRLHLVHRRPHFVLRRLVLYSPSLRR